MRCVEVRFHGHACFSARYGDVTVVFDPHDGTSLGIRPPEVTGDLVLVSHDHFDHNAVNVVSRPGTAVIKALEGSRVVQVKGETIRLEGYRVPHDKQGGRRRGHVSVHRIWLGDFVLVHLGDLGDFLPPEVERSLSTPRPDVLFVPVGGFFTIEPYEAWEVASGLNPVYIVPMHYWVTGLNLPIKPLQDFLLSAKAGREELDKLVMCEKRPAEEKSRIVVLRYGP